MQILSGVSKSAAALAVLLGTGAVCAQDSFTFPNCQPVTQANFRKVTLVDKVKDPSLAEPVRFGVTPDGRVIFGERGGNIKVIKTDGSIVKSGKLTVWTSAMRKGGENEFGLSGLVLDPAFATNNTVYIHYQPVSPDVFRISRFTMAGDMINLGSEQIILEHPIQKNYCCHTGGGMGFDGQGNLFIAMGNNTNNGSGYVDENDPDGDDQAHAANTNDLRGKILRIHPEAAQVAGKFYTIPAGNLKDAYASIWSAADLDKVRPEIYTMGHRSNYTLAVDKLKGWVMQGDIGPDDGWPTEEFNLITKPVNLGWPYFAGAVGNAHYSYRLTKDPAKPMNTSKNNTGAQLLPPATGATIGYNQSAAVTGPLFRWDASQKAATKFPPHFDGKWIYSDFNAGWIRAVTVNDAGALTGATQNFMSGLTRPLQVTIGPDGVLYYLEYAGTFFVTDQYTRITRLEYTGPSCVMPVATRPLAGRSPAVKSALVLQLGPEARVELPAGANGFRLYDFRGKLAWEYQAPSSRSAESSWVGVPKSLQAGVFRVAYR